MGRYSDGDSDDSIHERRRHRHRRSRSYSSDKSSGGSSVKRNHKKRSRRTSRSRSRSRSRDTRRKSSRKTRHRSSSRSSSRHRSRRSRSPSHKKRSRSNSREKHKLDKSQLKRIEPEAKLSNLSPEEQLKIKMQLALKAAAEADAQLREKGILPGGKAAEAISKDKLLLQHTQESLSTTPTTAATAPVAQTLSIQEQLSRIQAIDNINSGGFQQQEFKSSRFTPKGNGTGGHVDTEIDDHHTIIFGTNAESKAAEVRLTSKSSSNVILDKLIKDQLIHENLFEDVNTKQEKWVKKLYTMRQKKLNGEAMS